MLGNELIIQTSSCTVRWDSRAPGEPASAGAGRTAANVVVAVPNAAAATADYAEAAASRAASAAQAAAAAPSKGAFMASASRHSAARAQQVQLTPSMHQVPCVHRRRSVFRLIDEAKPRQGSGQRCMTARAPSPGRGRVKSAAASGSATPCTQAKAVARKYRTNCSTSAARIAGLYCGPGASRGLQAGGMSVPPTPCCTHGSLVKTSYQIKKAILIQRVMGTAELPHSVRLLPCRRNRLGGDWTTRTATFNHPPV